MTGLHLIKDFNLTEYKVVGDGLSYWVCLPSEKNGCGSLAVCSRLVQEADHQMFTSDLVCKIDKDENDQYH